MKNNQAKRRAASVALLVFAFMSAVSVLIYFTEDNLALFDLVLIVLAPIVLAAFFYFVVQHHDPKYSD